MAISWAQKNQTLENFLEEDLPFLIKSHYEDTIIILKKELKSINLSLDYILIHYPNFLQRIKYHLYFSFAYQMSELRSDCNEDLYAHYSAIATAYRNQYIYYFVENQIRNSAIRDIIEAQN